MEKLVQTTIKFENDFIQRSHRSLTSSPDIALTELIANGWDAGAFNVDVTIPTFEGDTISVEDDGIGMTSKELEDRWMTLKYNRQRHQGKDVVFPTKQDGYSRVAFGRNGEGRQSMFCFADSYEIETSKGGETNRYEVTLSYGENPYVLRKLSSEKSTKHGTKISTKLSRNLPNIGNVKSVISARYLYDPNFTLKINGEKLDLEKHINPVDIREVELPNGVKLEIITIDSSKVARSTQQHGIAFWVANRLVGVPSWSFNTFNYLDGRTSVAKRYTIIVKTNDLLDDVHSDWSSLYYSSPRVTSVLKYLEKYINEVLTTFMKEIINENRTAIVESIRDDVVDMSLSSKRIISTFIESLTQKQPRIPMEFLSNAVDAVVNIEKSRHGQELLKKLSEMNIDELDKLSTLLRSWDIDDVVTVISEIDNRLSTIEAITRVHADKNTDELNTLHPLVLKSRWLFGPEFDSNEYTSNQTLKTILTTHFKDTDIDKDAQTNWKKRPDIFILHRSSLSATCTDRQDDETGLPKPDKVLIIELKRGGRAIETDEMNQVSYYVRAIKQNGGVHNKCEIKAFVVGASIGNISPNIANDDGKIHATTYATLVDAAGQRLFGLREKLRNHYNEFGDKSLLEKALDKGTQTKMNVGMHLKTGTDGK